jgi:hypothetical protein
MDSRRFIDDEKRMIDFPQGDVGPDRVGQIDPDFSPRLHPALHLP